MSQGRTGGKLTRYRRVSQGATGELRVPPRRALYHMAQMKTVARRAVAPGRKSD